VKIFSTIKELETYKKSGDWALVSEDTPLLSHLTILENIALLKEFHHHEKIDKAEKEVQKLLAICGYGQMAHHKTCDISNEETFAAKYIRAVASDFDKILVVRPFDQAKSFDIMNLTHKLSTLFPKKEVEIIDTEANKQYYEGLECLIIK
jgi:ABC-type lipoprotein export system ATPase subunit